MPQTVRLTWHVGLLYSVVLGPDRRVRGDELLDIAYEAGFDDARTVLSTGNLLFRAEGKAPDLEIRLERAVAEHFGRLIPVFVRSRADWAALLAGNPFPEETRADPATVALRVLRQPMEEQTFVRIAARQGQGERIELRGKALWMASPGALSESPMFRAAGADWAGEGTFRSVSSAQKIAAAMPD